MIGRIPGASGHWGARPTAPLVFSIPTTATPGPVHPPMDVLTLGSLTGVVLCPRQPDPQRLVIGPELRQDGLDCLPLRPYSVACSTTIRTPSRSLPGHGQIALALQSLHPRKDASSHRSRGGSLIDGDGDGQMFNVEIIWADCGGNETVNPEVFWPCEVADLADGCRLVAAPVYE